MKTLIIGCKGYVGSHLFKAYSGRCLGTDRIGRDGLLPFDLLNPDLELLPIDWSQYSHAIVASGISKIALCEKEKKATHDCNVNGTLSLARQFRDKGIFSIYFSSDYVFDGTDDCYDESSPINPLNEYGRQKAILEKELPKICGDQHLILRLGKVFGITRGDKTLFDEMASLLTSGRIARCAQDQVFTPIFIDDVVQAIASLQNNNAHGLFNLCGNETLSRYDFACRVASSLKLEKHLIDKISLEDLNEPFKRPKKTGMNSAKWEKATGLKPSSIYLCIEKLAQSYI